MTCFWKGILKGLDINDLRKINIQTFPNIREFINILKNNNKLTTSIYWNSNEIRKQELKDNYKAIEDFNSKNINNGHLCSTCDYFLLLICELFELNIIHNYKSNIMKYIHIKKVKRTLYFKSDNGHFWFDRAIN